jgi:hypothetical protein
MEGGRKYERRKSRKGVMRLVAFPTSLFSSVLHKIKRKGTHPSPSAQGEKPWLHGEEAGSLQTRKLSPKF